MKRVAFSARLVEKSNCGSSLTMPPVSVSQTSPGTVRRIPRRPVLRLRLTSL